MGIHGLFPHILLSGKAPEFFVCKCLSQSIRTSEFLQEILTPARYMVLEMFALFKIGSENEHFTKSDVIPLTCSRSCSTFPDTHIMTVLNQVSYVLMFAKRTIPGIVITTSISLHPFLPQYSPPFPPSLPLCTGDQYK